jgi:hypothetical protein
LRSLPPFERSQQLDWCWVPRVPPRIKSARPDPVNLTGAETTTGFAAGGVRPRLFGPKARQNYASTLLHDARGIQLADQNDRKAGTLCHHVAAWGR